MKIGVTGSRDGMTIQQVLRVTAILANRQPDEVHHGDCIGSDANFHHIAMKLGIKRIVIHPPSNPSFRAECATRRTAPTGVKVKELLPDSYLERDRAIVDQTDALIATPKDHEENPRSGTWYTINYARRRNRPVTIVFPDGVVHFTRTPISK